MFDKKRDIRPAQLVTWLTMQIHPPQNPSIHLGTPSHHPFLDGICPYEPSSELGDSPWKAP